MTRHVTLQIEDRIATVTLTQPTMPPGLFSEIEGVFRELSANGDVRAVVVRSAAKAFSYGLDLPAAMQELGPHLAGGGTAAQRTELLAIIRRLQASFTAVAACPVPVIAAIHGWCVGGGLDLASACDVRVAAADARFALRETKIAIIADLGSLQRLPGIIGQGHTRELAFTGKDIGAARAAEIGLVNEVFPNADALAAGARAMAAEIAANPPLTVRGVKEVLAFGDGKPVAEGLSYVATWNAAFLASEDLGEALASFVERRAPAYKGR